MEDPESSQPPQPTAYVIILSGTHVTGKETLAFHLAAALHTAWLKAEAAHAAAHFGARAQARRGYPHDAVFGRIWLSKLLRMGLDLHGGGVGGGTRGDDTHDQSPPRPPPPLPCAALLTTYAMQDPARSAIRSALRSRGLQPVFVILHITPETLSGRTLGAEEPALAQRIMAEKVADIAVPAPGDDVLLIDCLRDLDVLEREIAEKVGRVVGR